MRSQLMLIVFLLTSVLSRAQVIDIYVTNQLKESDRISLNAYIDGLNKSLHRKYQGMSIMLHDYYSDFQSLIKDENDLLNFFVEENKRFTSENLFLKDLDSNLRSENSALIPSASGKLPACKNILKDVNSLEDFVKEQFKKSRRNKEALVVKVFFYNGYLLGKQDVKRLELSFEKARKSNDFSKLKPRFSWSDDHTFTPSNETGDYVIEFDSIGFYESYQIKIESLSESSPGVLIYENVKFDDNYNSDIKLKYTGNNRNCKFQISPEYLGTKCLKLLGGKIVIDDGCGECKEECLYGKAFQISIQGISGDFREEKLIAQTSKEVNIKFQCKNVSK